MCRAARCSDKLFKVLKACTSLCQILTAHLGLEGTAWCAAVSRGSGGLKCLALTALQAARYLSSWLQHCTADALCIVRSEETKGTLQVYLCRSGPGELLCWAGSLSGSCAEGDGVSLNVALGRGLASLLPLQASVCHIAARSSRAACAQL